MLRCLGAELSSLFTSYIDGAYSSNVTVEAIYSTSVNLGVLNISFMLWEIKCRVYRAVWACISLCLLGVGFDPHLEVFISKNQPDLCSSLLGASIIGVLAEDDKFHVNCKEAILRDR